MRASKLLGFALMLAPLAVQTLMDGFDRPPTEIVLATGPAGSADHALGAAFAELASQRLGLTVHVMPTIGALGPLDLAQQRLADLALTRAGLVELLRDVSPTGSLEGFQHDAVTLVASVALEPMLLVHRADRVIAGPVDLAGLRVSIGRPSSFSHAVAQVQLRSRAGLANGPVWLELGEGELSAAFDDGRLDAAFVLGRQPSPALDVLLARRDLVHTGLPRGKPWNQGRPDFVSCGLPGGDAGQATVGTVLQLLTHGDTHPALVERLARLLLDPSVTGALGLTELAARGVEFATSHASHPLHPGARAAFGLDPMRASRLLRTYWGVSAGLLIGLAWALLPLLTRRPSPPD